MAQNERKRKKYAKLWIGDRRLKIQKSTHANKIARERTNSKRNFEQGQYIFRSRTTCGYNKWYTFKIHLLMF